MISVQFSGIDTVRENLLAYEADQVNRLRLACIEFAHWIEQYAIMHHPWQVRTQLTNVTTHGTFDQVADDLFEVVLSAGSPYSKYLELAGPEAGGFAAHLASLPLSSLSESGLGAFAWIWPTCVANAEMFLQIIQRHLRH